MTKRPSRRPWPPRADRGHRGDADRGHADDEGDRVTVGAERVRPVDREADRERELKERPARRLEARARRGERPLEVGHHAAHVLDERRREPLLHDADQDRRRRSDEEHGQHEREDDGDDGAFCPSVSAEPSARSAPMAPMMACESMPTRRSKSDVDHAW